MNCPPPPLWHLAEEGPLVTGKSCHPGKFYAASAAQYPADKKCKEDHQRLLDGRNSKVPKTPSRRNIRYQQRSDEISGNNAHPALHNAIVGEQINLDKIPPTIESSIKKCLPSKNARWR